MGRKKLLLFLCFCGRGVVVGKRHWQGPNVVFERGVTGCERGVATTTVLLRYGTVSILLSCELNLAQQPPFSILETKQESVELHQR